MEMPTIQDLFYLINGYKTTSSELDDVENTLRHYLKILTEKKNLKSSAADKISETAEEISRTAKCAGFALGFSVAVNLFTRRD